jgi:tetratricopeptide (TPR) repeat protein
LTWERRTEEAKEQNLIFRFILLLLLFLNPSHLFATEISYGDVEKQFYFAESLFSEGDYDRAITEYKRFIFLYPEDRRAENSFLRIIESYHKEGKWNQAIEAVKNFSAGYKDSSFIEDAKYLKGLAENELKQYENALLTFQEIINGGSLKYRDKSIFQSAIILMNMEEWQKAQQMFQEVPQTSSLAFSSKVFYSGLENIEQIPQKSTSLAGTLATLLPGAGHLYTGRYQDAIMTFLLNGAFIWAGIELFQHDNRVAGGIVSFFELGWYVGNIYSAINCAHKYNRRMKEEFIKHLEKAAGISVSYDPYTLSSRLMISFKF